MAILEIRILPPIGIGRLGDATTPMEAYDLVVDPANPLAYRTIVPETTLTVDPISGIPTSSQPEKVIFKESTSVNSHQGAVRPVAPFLEVFAILDSDPDNLVPLTTDLLAQEGLSVADISWDVEVGNVKLYRRTFDPNDKIEASILGITTHDEQPLNGTCPNFRIGKTLNLGKVQFVAPNLEFPGIRFRYTPGPGKVYGASTTRINETTLQPEPDPIYEQDGDSFLLYKEDGPWTTYSEADSDASTISGKLWTNPAMIYAGYTNADGAWASRGYVDDECDGHVTVNLNTLGGPLTARAVIGAGPPAYAPDTLPVRVVSDEIEQILLGPEVPDEVPIDEAEEIIRRALETVRLMNTAVMNGNAVDGKLNRASTMVRQGCQ